MVVAVIYSNHLTQNYCHSQGHCERFAPKSVSLWLVHRSFVSPVVHQQVWRPHQFRMNPDAFDSTVRGFVPLHLVILPLLRIILITLIILIILMIILPLLMRMNNIRDHGRSQATQIVSCDLHVLVVFINAVISFKQSTSIKSPTLISMMCFKKVPLCIFISHKKGLGAQQVCNFF